MSPTNTMDVTPATTNSPSNAPSGTGTNIELQPIPSAVPPRDQSLPEDEGSKSIDPVEYLPQPSTTVSVVQRWNNPKINIYRTAATLVAFVIMGANDAVYGALIPYLEEYYQLSYVVVSLVFLSPLGGYAGAALLNNWIHIHWGQRGVAFIGPMCHVLAYLGICLHPPYPVLVVIFIVAGFGNGLEDAAWNAWAGSLANSNEVLGFLHGFYGLGAVLSPLVATNLVVDNKWSWYAFYYIMLGGAVIELATSLTAFWLVSGQIYREINPRSASSKDSRLKEALKVRVTWMTSVFLLGYVGAEVALGGWIVTFMRRERAGGDYESGMVATGFWTGITVGRLVLGFVTPKLGEKFAVLIYIIFAMVCQIVFWLVPQFHVSAIFVSLQGFLLGPLFPAAVVAATKTLPTYLHVSAIGFAAAFGGGGAAIIPFAIGSLAQAQGVKVLQPVILAVLAILIVLWLCFPKLDKSSKSERPIQESGPRKQCLYIDFDLLEVGRRALQKLRGQALVTQGWNGVRQHFEARREVKAERRYVREQIQAITRDTLPFVILEGVDPESEAPPPYVNVRSQMVY